MHKKVANENKQILSSPEEKTLVDWIGYQAAIAKPLDREEIRSLVLDITGIFPGLNWIYRFKQRHPEICASQPGNLDPKRAQNFNVTNVAHFYKLLKDVYDAYPNIPPEHIWNMDEKGVQFGGGRKWSKKYYHLRSLRKSKFYRIHSDNLELITIIECISPSELSVPPSFVLSSGPIPSFPDPSFKIVAIVTSPNGWTNNKIGTAWFMETFILFANDHKVTDAPIVLLLDRHNSHKSDAFHEAMFQNDIIIITFPSKCTHKLQPLDIVIFAQTQHHWSSHCDNHITHHIKMDHYNIILEYMEVHPRSMTPKLLCSAFSTTGIFPYNDTLFTDIDFASAKSFSYTMHIPQSFPPEVLTSSPIASDVSNVEMSSDKSDSAESVAADAPAAQTLFSWGTDSDDFDFEDPQPSHFTAPAAAVMPTVASCPSHIIPSMPPVSAPPTVSNYMGASELPRPWDASSSTQATRYFTHSQASQMPSLSLGSSPALSISVTLNPT